jgi:hypothetical protein
MSLDIHTGVQTAFLLAVLGVILSLFLGIQSIRTGRHLLYFRKRRDLILRGWRLIFIALGLTMAAFLLGRFAEPTAYRIFPPSPTITLTPTMTLIPTITLTPTISLTPTITDTPSITSTPEVPEVIATLFSSSVTPNPKSVFSPLQFSKELGKDKLPINPATEFKNPVGKLIGSFSYDQMLQGSQWTTIWLRVVDQKIICYETNPWDGSTGGYGTTECEPSSDQWQAGEYEVQIFVGSQWIVSSRFIVTGEPPTPSLTPTPSRTPTSTFTPAPTRTPIPSLTPKPTIPTSTMIPTITRRPTQTPPVASNSVNTLTPVN